MPGMPRYVSKGEILQRFDAFCNADHADPSGSGATIRGAKLVLDYYKTNGHIDQWLAQAETGWTTGGKTILETANKDREHVEKYWFGSTQRPSHAGGEKRNQRKAWWPEMHKMDRVLKPGLKMALRLCLFEDADDTQPRAQPLDLDCYRVCAGHHYEVSSLVSAKQVTLLISTPSPTFSRRSGKYTDPEDIWITRSGGKERGEKKFEEHAKDVITVRPKYHRMDDL